jgi:Leucine-rich repeat (LRR) protein
LRRLEELFLSHNYLKQLPGGLYPTIQKDHAFQNYISAWTSQIDHLVDLKELTVFFNAWPMTSGD